MKKITTLFMILLLAAVLTACVGSEDGPGDMATEKPPQSLSALPSDAVPSKTALQTDADDFYTVYFSPYLQAVKIQSASLRALPAGLTYREIIKTLGSTRDAGSGLHVAVYIVDGREFFLSFADDKDACALSGEELYQKMLADANNSEEKKENAYVVTDEAPVYDAETGNEAGKAYPGFALYLQGEAQGRVYFEKQILPVDSPKTGTNSTDQAPRKKYYIPVEYLQKSYKKPIATLTVIGGKVRVNAGAVLAGKDGNALIRFEEPFGPIYYIYKTDEGCFFTLGFNLLCVRQKDAELIEAGYE